MWKYSVRIVLVTIIACDVSERRHIMSFIKRNCTIVVLVAIIISALSFNALAINQIVDWPNLSLVNVLRKQIIGAAPQTEEAFLRTSSDIYDHYSYVEVGCFVCGGWVYEYSTTHGYTPDDASVGKYFPNSCWFGGEEHTAAGFDIELYPMN